MGAPRLHACTHEGPEVDPEHEVPNQAVLRDDVAPHLSRVACLQLAA